jgi:uncharacterized DUF497 family protein
VEFEWDENKNASNLRKHGVAYEDAAAIFDDPMQLTERARQTAGEARWQTIGMAGGLAYIRRGASTTAC